MFPAARATYANATRANRGWRGQALDVPPIDTIYVVRTMDRNGQFLPILNSTGVVSAWLYMKSTFTHQTTDVHSRVDNLAKHEAGHGYGVANGTFGAPPSVMGQNSIVNGNYFITSCDTGAHRRVYCPTPTPTPTPDEPPYCNPDGAGMNCFYATAQYCSCIQEGSLGFWYEPECECQFYTPILIDVAGNGFSLTNAANGVDFDLTADGVIERLSWTSEGSDDAWLVLDRNQNGMIDDGAELFGNYTPQPVPPDGEERNGFLALAVFDDLAKGGNGDGQIDQRDAVFNRLRLWRDTNHNGVSDAGETRRLLVSPIRILELNYHESRRRDEYGNAFRYRAIVRDERGAQVGRWAWDVFLRRENPITMSGLKSQRNEFSAVNSSCGLLR